MVHSHSLDGLMDCLYHRNYDRSQGSGSHTIYCHCLVYVYNQKFIGLWHSWGL